jgi:gas vesicle protein
MRELMGFIAGLAVGVAVGLLYAPKSGAEIRAELSTAAQAEWEAADAQLRKELASVQQQLSKLQAQDVDVDAGSAAAEEDAPEEVDEEVEADA